MSKFDTEKFDTEYYDIEFLKKEDKERIEEVRKIREGLLDRSIINDYIADKVPSEIVGKQFRQMIAETCAPFLDYIKDSIDQYIIDYIIEKQDDYTPEEYEQLKRQSEERPLALAEV